MIRTSTLSPSELAVEQRWRAGRGVPERVGGQVVDHALQDARVDLDLGQVRRDLDQHRLAAWPEVVEGAGDHFGEVGGPREDRHRARLEPAHVEQVLHQPGELVQRFVGGGKQFVVVLGGPLHIMRPQAGHRGLGRRKRGAQIVADRGEQGRPHPVGFGDRPGRLGLGGQPLLLQGSGRVSGERTQHPPVRRRATDGRWRTGTGQPSPAWRHRRPPAGRPDRRPRWRPPAIARASAPTGAAVRSSSVTLSIPKASRTRSTTACSGCSPRRMLPAVVTSRSDSALALAACFDRLAASFTIMLTTIADDDEDDQR